MSELKIIGAGVFVPLFSNKRSERASYREFLCLLDGECSLLKRGHCIQTGMFDSCPFGRETQEVSKTKRARAYLPWVADRKNRVKELEAEGKVLPSTPQRSLEFIGDMVWLPYGHMTMCKAVPFGRHSDFMIDGSPFLKREDFTIENIKTLIEFVPRGLLDYTPIRVYQEKEVPRFLRALRTRAPELFQELIENDPAIVDRIPKLESITVPLNLIPPGVSEGYLVEGKHKPVEWDGQHITVKGAMSIIGLSHRRGEVEVKCEPTENMKVTVSDELLIEQLAEKHPEYAK